MSWKKSVKFNLIYLILIFFCFHLESGVLLIWTYQESTGYNLNNFQLRSYDGSTPINGILCEKGTTISVWSA